MKIIQRYYLKEFFKLFAIIGFGLSFVFSLMNLINKIDDFIPHNPSVYHLLLYSGLNLPQYFLYLMPMSALIGGLFVFGQAAKRKETTAIKAAGGGMKALLMPFVYLGAFLSVAGFLMSEFVVPDSSRKAHALRDTLSRKDNKLAFKEGAVWLRTNYAIVKIDLVLPEKGFVRGVSIMKMENDMLTERIEAESAEWHPALGPASPDASISQRAGESSGVWNLREVTTYDIRTGTVTKNKDLQSNLIESPDIFREDFQKPEEMNVRELAAYTKRLRNAGFRNSKLIVDIHSRISYPLINAIMLVLGVALAARGVVGGGLITAAVGIFISLLYWVAYTTSLSLGYTGILPPLAAAWLMPMLFAGMAFYLFIQIPE